MVEIKTWNSIAIGDDAFLNIRSINNEGDELVITDNPSTTLR